MKPILADILVTEAQPANLDALRQVLGDCGYRVRPVPNGALALRAARQSAPDLILLDTRMPEMDGFETCRQLKGDEKLREIPVIMLGAETAVCDKVAAFQCGAADYIVKPFSLEELRVRVQTHVRWRKEAAERKRTEEALREAEARMRVILNSMQMGVVVIDPETHTIVEANPFAVQMIGEPKEQIVGSVCHKYICPAEKGSCPITDLGQTVDNSERVLLQANGEETSILKTIAPVVLGGKQHLIETFVDLAAQKESELERAAILNAALDAICVVDLDGRILEVNEACSRISGYSREELLRLRIADLMPSSDPAELQRLFAKIVGAGFDRLEIQYRRKDGTVLDLEISAQFSPLRQGCLIAVGRDVTQRKRDEEALRESETQLRQIAETIQEVFWASSPDASELLYVSPACESVWGISREQLHQNPLSWMEAIHPEDRESFLAAFATHAQGQYETEYRIVLPDGTVRWIHDRGLPVKDDQGRIVRMVGAAMDITQRKQAEEETRRLNEELERRVIERTSSLLESEDRYRDLVENSRDLICTHDLGGRLLSVNPWAARSLGYTPDELIGMSLADISTPESRAGLGRYLARIEKRGSARGLMTVQSRSGEKRVWEYHNTLRTEGVAAPVVRGIAHDITERYRAEEVLRRQAQLFAQVHDSIISTDPDGFITHYNLAAQKLFGYSADEVVGRHVSMFYAEEDRQSIQRRVIEPLMADGFLEMDEYVVHKSGARLLIRSSLSLLRDRAGRVIGMVGCSIDITKRRRDEEALRLSEERYRDLVATVPGTVYSFRIDAEGRRSMPFISRGATALTGIPPQTIMDDVQAAFDLIPAEEMSRFEQSIAESWSRLSPWRLDFAIHSAEGEERWIRGHAMPTRGADGATVWNGIFIDITAEKQAQGELEQSERRYRQLVEHIHDAILVDDIEGRLVFANPRFLELFGLEDADVHEFTLEDYVAPEWREMLRDRHDRRVRGEQVPDHFEYEGLRADGTRIWIEVIVSSLVANGQIVGTQSALRDVTHRKQLEEQNRQSQRLESIALLAGGVAHDFNNLLTVINGYSERILSKMNALDPLRNHVKEIAHAGERAADLTRQLMAFGRMQPSSPTTVDVNDLISQDEPLIRRIVGEDVEVSVHLGKGYLSIKADPAQLHQVLLNLVVNAREAMPDGGHLVIETSKVEIGEDYVRRHTGTKSGRFVCVEVSDTGIGMDHETSQRLFEPFFTTKETGTGLGLATVYGIVKQQEGWIFVYSEPGKGSSFKVYLPYVGESGSVKEANPIAATPGRGTETILIVEDQVEVRMFAVEILRHLGYQVLDAAGGAEALEMLQEYDGPVHLLLTDVVMPRMNGRDLAQQVKRLRPNIRVLFMSGYGENVIAKHGVLDPGVQYLLKPFDANSLTAKLRTVLDKGVRKARIVVADDEAAVRGLMVAVLRDAGYEVIEAADGSEAMRIICHQPVDILITDLVMPERDGIETIRALHRSQPQLKIIAISGFFGGQFLAMAPVLGAHATLLKPVSPKAIVGKVQELLRG